MVVLTCSIAKGSSCRESAKADSYRRSKWQLTSRRHQDAVTHESVRYPNPIGDVVEQKLLQAYSLQDKESSRCSLLDRCARGKV